jgi:L-amino acid N-acyltransferase YncA
MDYHKPEIIVRNARISDAADITEILNKIIEKGTDTIWDLPSTPEFEREWMQNLRPRSLLNVAEREEDGKVIGFQMISPMLRYFKEVHHVGNMWLLINIADRGKGIGSYLANFTFIEAKKMGYEKIHVHIREDNLNSLLFALKLGFRIIGTAENHARWHSTYLNITLLEKSIV